MQIVQTGSDGIELQICNVLRQKGPLRIRSLTDLIFYSEEGRFNWLTEVASTFPWIQTIDMIWILKKLDNGKKKK